MINRHLNQDWDKDFFKKSPMFKQLSVFLPELKREHWPDISWFNQLAKNVNLPPPRNTLGQSLLFKDEVTALESLSYEEKIYHHAVLPTRLNNWHDLFNHLSWLAWPKLKALMNSLYVKENTKRLANQPRTQPQHFIAQFDECGVILCLPSKYAYLKELISNHQWSQLFIEHADVFENDIDCLVLGHALFEKALNPYVGLTAKAIILEVDDSFCKLSLTSKQKNIDAALSKSLRMQSLNVNMLSPFPILGIPGWFTNQDSEFYANQQYFRGKSAKLVALP